MENFLSQNAGGTYVGQGMYDDNPLSDRKIETVNYCLKVALIIFLVAMAGFFTAVTSVIVIEYQMPDTEYRRI